MYKLFKLDKVIGVNSIIGYEWLICDASRVQRYDRFIKLCADENDELCERYVYFYLIEIIGIEYGRLNFIEMLWDDFLEEEGAGAYSLYGVFDKVSDAVAVAQASLEAQQSPIPPSDD
jgi:hypothetical protein